MIRHSQEASESWKSLPWKKFRCNLFRLQKRVFKAVQAGDKRKAMSALSRDTCKNLQDGLKKHSMTRFQRFLVVD
jgi:N-terminal domain of reverse transcriptase